MFLVTEPVASLLMKVSFQFNSHTELAVKTDWVFFSDLIALLIARFRVKEKNKPTLTKGLARPTAKSGQTWP